MSLIHPHKEFLVESKTLNAKYTDPQKMVRDLIANKAGIYQAKKDTVKDADGIRCFIKETIAPKEENNDILKIGDIIQAVINTTGILDSHEDVHIPGIWNKSVNDQQGKIYHAINHQLSIGTLVGYPSAVKMEVKNMPWSQLGRTYQGNTDALVFNTLITDKTNIDAFKAYRDREPIQHSIRMLYVQLVMCINDPEEKEYYSNWLKYRSMVANGEDADNLGYFFAIPEAKIYKEGSTVLFGSDPETPYMGFNGNNQLETKQEVEYIDLKEALKSESFINM